MCQRVCGRCIILSHFGASGPTDELTQLYYIHDMLPTMHFEGNVGKRALVLAQSFGEVRRVLMSADFLMRCLTAKALYVAPQGVVSRDNVVLFSQERAVLAV